MALVRAQVKALVFKRNYGLVKRGRDLLQRNFSFSDAHAVANGISSLHTVRSCRLQAYKNDVYIMPKEPTLRPHSSLSVSTHLLVFSTVCVQTCAWQRDGLSRRRVAHSRQVGFLLHLVAGKPELTESVIATFEKDRGASL